MSSKVNNLYEFGAFRFDPETNTLRRGEELIALSPKALELLKLLVERRGEIVSKQEIFDTVWAGTFVEEGVLTQNIYTLRRVLGKDENGKQLIENVARRGYRLAVPVRSLEKPASLLTAPDQKAGEILFATQTTVTEEIIEEDGRSLLAGKLTFYRRKPFWLFGFATGLFLLLGFFLYLFPPRLLSAIFKPPGSGLRFQRLTDTGDIAYLVVSPDGQFVAFNRGKDIFLKDVQSDSEIKLNLENVENVGCLQFSADSSYIFFGDNSEPNSPGRIFQTGRLGGAKKLVAENVWSGFSLSPDGRTLAFHRKFPNENKWVLVLKNLETKAETELAPRKMPELYYWNNYPAWSPDGQKLAVVVIARTEHFLRLLTVDPKTGREVEIKTRDFRNVEQVVWAADGSSLIASANDGKTFQIWQIYPQGETRRITNDLNSYLGVSITRDRSKLIARQRIYYSNIWIAGRNDPENLRQLTVGTSHNDGLKGLAWLDNQKIIYTSNIEKLRDWNLWLLDTSDDSRRELTFDKETQNEEPAVSPGGNIIYFSSNRGTSAHIWQVSAEDREGKPRQITFSENSTELFPQISPDGVWLYYIQKSQNSSAIWRQSLTDGRTEKLSDEKNLLPDTFLSLSPDGRFLAFHDLTGETLETTDSKNFQIGVMQTENPSEIKFFNLPAAHQSVRWRTGEEAFDFVSESLEDAQVWRQNLDQSSNPKLILTIPKDNIFNFAWSPDGQNLALARGQLLRDVVLLTNFSQ